MWVCVCLLKGDLSSLIHGVKMRSQDKCKVSLLGWSRVFKGTSRATSCCWSPCWENASTEWLKLCFCLCSGNDFHRIPIKVYLGRVYIAQFEIAHELDFELSSTLNGKIIHLRAKSNVIKCIFRPFSRTSALGLAHYSRRFSWPVQGRTNKPASLMTFIHSKDQTLCHPFLFHQSPMFCQVSVL